MIKYITYQPIVPSHIQDSTINLHYSLIRTWSLNAFISEYSVYTTSVELSLRNKIACRVVDKAKLFGPEKELCAIEFVAILTDVNGIKHIARLSIYGKKRLLRYLWRRII